MSDVYVVTIGYDWEGDSLLWAGLDREAAFAFADGVAHGDTVTVARCAPTPEEVWTRPRLVDDAEHVVYTHRVPVPGMVDWQALGELTRTRSP